MPAFLDPGLKHSGVTMQVDVHAGYFDGVFTRSLIYRSACLARPDLLQSLGGTSDIAELSAECKQRQIKALLAEVQG